jgi:hypothetical protein
MFMRILLCFSAAIAMWAAPPAARDFEVGGSGWVDTGIDLKSGDTVKIAAAGTIQFANAKPAGPEGLQRGWTDLIRQLPVNDVGRGALVGRISNSDAARPFLIGPRTERTAGIPGRLYLGINAAGNDRPSGAFKVTVDVVAGVARTTPANVKLPEFTQQQIDSIPVRVQDAEGTQGDRVNFIVIGSQNSVETAFRLAGWVTVDKTSKDALFRGLLSSLSKQAYTTLPMSELMLFGRTQDYAYAQGDPVRVVASRHHFRLWKAPFTADGQTVWAGAGTHDIGFDKDQRNGNITHKIDPNTDAEREYIGESLRQTGMTAKLDYLKPKDAITAAKTAHGEEFTSDGRTLIVYLNPDQSDSSVQFADLFCSVLKQKNPDGGDWGDCNQYFEGGGKSTANVEGPVSDKYRVLIVPGILSSCVSSDSPAFMEGQKDLKERYKLAVDLINVPNDPSEENAKMIAAFLKQEAAKDPRKFIVVGYSKGAPDVQTALAKEGIVDRVAAFVSVAGAIGGSAIADALPAAADKWIRQYNMKGCQGDLASGMKSLQKSARQAFLASYPHPFVPTYSIVAKSDKLTTSKALLQTWQLLSAYGPVQDGQLMKEDAVVPESKYLGVALADHFAVALPFDKSSDASIKAGMDKTKYPRAALLEAIVRFVSADLDSKAVPSQ